MAEYVVLVDEKDRRVGIDEKIEAHRKGILHRAFSIFIVNPAGSLLLQKRNPLKYHCGNLWSNSCCSHPSPYESMRDALHRRLFEEMGFDCKLHYAGSMIYSARFTNGLIENEFDHIFYGIYDGEIEINPREVSDYVWVGIPRLEEDLNMNPRKYTPWLLQLYPDLNPAHEQYSCRSF